MPLGAFKSALFGASADTGSAVLLSTATASSDASIEFTLPTAYKQVVFGFYNVTPASDSVHFQVQSSIDGGSNYNVTMTTTYFRCYNFEDGAGGGSGYLPANDQAQGTGYQTLGKGVGSASDESCAGEMHLFNPASTTYVKHFYSTMQFYETSSGVAYPHTTNAYVAGYFNDGANDLTNISFKMSSGNISSGVIRMWGIK